MRHLAAAANAVTSAPPLIPQPDFSNNDTNGTSDYVSDAGNVTHTTREPIHDRNNPERHPSEHAQQTQQTTTNNKKHKHPLFATPNSNSAGNIQPAPQFDSNNTTQLQNSLVIGLMGSLFNPNLSAAANINSMIGAAGYSTEPPNLSENVRRLATELEDAIDKGLRRIRIAEKGETEAVVELQLQTARILRQVLPTNRDLLYLVCQKDWTSILLDWLNLHDRPAVQVEALLALTNIAEICQQCFYQQHTGNASFGMPNLSNIDSSTVTDKKDNTMSSPSSSSPSPNFLCNYNMMPYPNVGQEDLATQAYLSAIYSSCPQPNFQNADGNITNNVPDKSQNKDNIHGNDNTLSQTSKPNNTQIPLFPPMPFGKDKNGNMAQISTQRGVLPPNPYGNFGIPQFPNSNISTKSMNDGMSFPFHSNNPPIFNMNFKNHPIPPLSLPTNQSIANSVPNVQGNFPPSSSNSSQHVLLRHSDTIPTLISLLSSPNREVYEQAMWILGTIAAGDSPVPINNPSYLGQGPNQFSPPHPGHVNNNLVNNENGENSNMMSTKEIVLAAGVITPLLNCLESNANNVSLQRIGSWVLSNLVETKTHQGKSRTNSLNNNTSDSASTIDLEIHKILPTLARLLDSADHEVLGYTCWALSHICDGPASTIAAVVTTTDVQKPPGGLVPKLIDLLLHPNWKVTKPALRTIGNIVCAECGDDAYFMTSSGTMEPSSISDFTEVILECDAIPRLKLLINHGNREIQKEACWTLSNIAAGTIDQIQAVIDAETVAPLVALVNDSNTDKEVRSEACWFVLNSISCGSDEQVERLVNEGCISVLGLLLEETGMIQMALEGFERVLQVEENCEMKRRSQQQLKKKSNSDLTVNATPTPQPSKIVNASLILKALELSHSIKNPAVSKRALRIWKQHFVTCALCNQSYSKHHPLEYKFCDECKCFVCSKCDCMKYHLSYQEEWWAATEEKNAASKQAKKSKKQKKKEKRKEKTKTGTQKDVEDDVTENQGGEHSEQNTNVVDDSTHITVSQPITNVSSTKLNMSTENKSSLTHATVPKSDLLTSINRISSEIVKKLSPTHSTVTEGDAIEDTMNRDVAETEQNQPPIDFVLYLQQTGSIIALSRLMDALDEGQDYKSDDNFGSKLLPMKACSKENITN